MESTACLKGAVVHAHGGDATSREHWWKLQHPVPPYWNGSNYPHKPHVQRILTSTGSFYSKDSSVSRMYYLHTRFQRGLLSYEKCKVPELRMFCQQRGIGELQGYIKKVNLMELLEKADEDGVFPRFLDLPPELRVLVYEQFFDKTFGPARSHRPNNDWRANLLYLEPPPLVSACKLLRKEVLPLFYSLARPEIRVIYPRLPPNHRQEYIVAPGTFGIFEKAPMLVLESIKTLTIPVAAQWFGQSLPRSNITWEIVLPTTSTPGHVRRVPNPRLRAPKGAPPHSEEFEQELQKMFSGMTTSHKGSRVKFERSHGELIANFFKEMEHRLQSG